MILKFDDIVARDLAYQTPKDKDIDSAVVYAYLKSKNTHTITTSLNEMTEELPVYNEEELDCMLETLAVYEYVTYFEDDNNNLIVTIIE